ncbi:MAG: recombinase RecB [Ramlibacter sp.]|jgi:hypothetical protein|nr:recombinase RecB [Ramlibacter sp.]
MDEPTVRPPVWRLVRDAAREIGIAGKEMPYAAIKQHVWDRYPDVNPSTLACQIIICTVNQPSRVHYPENKKPRRANGNYDFLYSVGRGTVVLYDEEKHGQWEIVPKGAGLAVRLVSEPVDEEPTPAAQNAQGGTFALEAHLRDYLARNLPTLDEGATPLKLFTSDDGRGGVEFQTDVGPIDILAVSVAGHFYLFELKLGRGADAALGQILRYMGWVKHHLCGPDRQVHGIVVASDIGSKLRYAATQVPNVRLMEYELSVALRPCQLVSGLGE